MTEDLGVSLSKTLNESKDLKSIVVNMNEIVLDKFLDDGIAKEIPFIKTIVSLFSVGISIKDRSLVKKLAKFIFELESTTPSDRTAVLYQMKEDSYLENVGEKIILILDRLDDVDKATFIGKAFSAYIQNRISLQILKRMNLAIDRTPTFELLELKVLYKENANQIDNYSQQMYTTAGLITFKLSSNSMGFEWVTELCNSMVTHIL